MNRQMKRILLTVIVVAVGWIAQQAGLDLSALTGSQGSAPSSTTPSPGGVASLPNRSDARSERSSTSTSSAEASRANQRIEDALAARESGFMITLDARVTKTLPDDEKGSRHQRFLIELETGRSILVAHNIDLAKRVPLERGDAVRIYGQFEWNDKGGVLHWTHRDPRGRHAGGWIEHEGKRID